MPVKTLRLSELANLPATEKLERLKELVAARNEPLNGEAAYLDRRIAEFEQRYELSSNELVQRYNRGEQRETAEIGNWLMLLRLRQAIVEPSA